MRLGMAIVCVLHPSWKLTLTEVELEAICLTHLDTISITCKLQVHYLHFASTGYL